VAKRGAARRGRDGSKWTATGRALGACRRFESAGPARSARLVSALEAAELAALEGPPEARAVTLLEVGERLCREAGESAGDLDEVDPGERVRLAANALSLLGGAIRGALAAADARALGPSSGVGAGLAPSKGKAPKGGCRRGAA
jgi:hypothetical protein